MSNDKYGKYNPSLINKGNILNVDIQRNKNEQFGWCVKSKETGTATSKMLFSCTWNENKKKHNEQMINDNLNFSKVGCHIKSITEGKTESKVTNKHTRTIVSLPTFR